MNKMNALRFALAICIVFSCSIMLSAEDAIPPQTTPTPDKIYDEALGFFAGEMTGTGLSYHKTNGDSGWQAVAGALYLPPQADADLLYYNLGVSFQRKVYANSWQDILAGNLYIFTSLLHRGRIPVIEGVDEATQSITYTPGSFSAEISAGFGIGIEIIAFEHFSVPIEIGYGFSYLPLESNVIDMFAINLYPQAGFRYRY